MWNGTQTMVNDKGKEALAKLSTSQRIGEAAKGVAKVGGVVGGTAIAGGLALGASDGK